MNTLAAQAVPEILAPAGGRAQFFAALQSGADAVYLGMKSFNARARAENFGEDDLRELVPLAHAFGMRVLVAVNVLIKEAELPELVRTLSSLEELEVDAIIVQDLGVARLAQTHFPKLRLHASTQMAVHNEAGVRAAFEFGFRRVVVARELTAVEMKRIRAAAPRPDANGDGGIEIEAFCHGSLCYSYSGLCFFSGSEDARSGNRGECAYTCRQPYKITSEPGHGFLFSMKDLDTSASIRHFVEAGIDTLKIEGRKKDAQYVSSTVRLYRSALDQHFGRSTLRANAPEAARAFDGEAADGIERDLALSFHRGRTSFFLNGRYVENVIDLASPTHLGLECGKVTAVHGRRIAFATQTAIERFDGLKIVAAGPVFHARPQDGDRVRGSTETMSELYERKAAEFSLRELTVAGKRAFAAAAGTIVEVEMPDGVPMPVVGDEVRKIRSADLKRRVERLESVPEGARLRSLRNVEIEVAATQLADALCIEARATKFGSELTRAKIEIPALRSTKDGSWRSDAEDAFAILGDVGFAATRLAVSGDADWFVPRSRLKELKRELAAKLPAAYAAFVAQRLQAGLDTLSPAIAHREGGPAFAMRYGGTVGRSSGGVSYCVKTDRLETARTVLAYAAAHPDFTLSELIFEPKRAFLPSIDPEALSAELTSLDIPLRLAIPTVLRAWDEPLLKRWLQVAHARGVTRFEVGNVGALLLLKDWGIEATDVAADFTLYALNSETHRFWRERGVGTVCLSVEDDRANLTEHLARLTLEEVAATRVILFKDTPLFIAEACSLTALHDGCPTAKVCGYRSLTIENPKGERFYVAHESCKSIVYGEEAYAITAAQTELVALGIRDFRLDFLTREYAPERVFSVLDAARRRAPLPGTHTANYGRTLA